MSKNLQVSVLVYTLLYPERTERCMESLNRQKNVQLDIKLLVDKKNLKTMKKRFKEISTENVYMVSENGIGKHMREILKECAYDNIMIVSSDGMFEEDAFEKILSYMDRADGLVFNLSVVRSGLRCANIYPQGLFSDNIFQDRVLAGSDDEAPFSATDIYTLYPNVWNHVFQKKILLRHKLVLEDFSRPAQYFFVAMYHSYCSTLKINTSLYGYREHQAEKILPGAGFCTRHYLEAIGLIRRSYRRMTPETVRLLSNDFRISVKQAVIAMKKKLKKEYNNHASAGEV